MRETKPVQTLQRKGCVPVFYPGGREWMLFIVWCAGLSAGPGHTQSPQTVMFSSDSSSLHLILSILSQSIEPFLGEISHVLYSLVTSAWSSPRPLRRLKLYCAHGIVIIVNRKLFFSKNCTVLKYV